MPPVGFEVTIYAGKRSQAQASGRAASEIGSFLYLTVIQMPNTVTSIRKTEKLWNSIVKETGNSRNK